MRATDLVPPGGADLYAYNALVAAPAPASASDELWVTVPSFDGGTHLIGPCHWQPIPGALPAVGDRCVVLLADEDATPWVVLFDGRDLALPSWVTTSDSRLSDARTPTGAAGGVLSGSYPNPTLARPFATGTITITWPGGGSLSNAMTIPHGLGSAPADAQATSNDPNLNVGVTSVDATNIVIQAREVNGATKGAGSFGAARWRAQI